MKLLSVSLIVNAFVLAASAQAQTVPGNAAAGKAEVVMCEGCHNAHGKGFVTRFPEVYHAPMLNGQSAAYIAQCLKDYRNGTRHNPTMESVASILTPQQIANLSAYYALGKNQSVK